MADYRINISDILDTSVKKGSRVFAVAGSGGKTTFIQKAAMHYAAYDRIGVAASTKMFYPKDEWHQNVHFYYDEMLPNGKIAGICDALIEEALRNEKLLFIEADGSNRKPLKGWHANEPVIPERTDVTVGIFPLSCLGKKVSPLYIHRIDAFEKITGLKEGDIITQSAYSHLIKHENGLFQYAKGKRILFLNHIDSEKAQAAAVAILAECRPYYDEGYYGDLMHAE